MEKPLLIPIWMAFRCEACGATGKHLTDAPQRCECGGMYVWKANGFHSTLDGTTHLVDGRPYGVWKP